MIYWYSINPHERRGDSRNVVIPLVGIRPPAQWMSDAPIPTGEKPHMPRIIGLTGNIACGKTAVGHMLLELGAEKYIDADAVVHRLYQSGQPLALQVAAAFGPTVIAADGS